MLHAFFERTNGNTVRVCSVGNCVARPQAALPAAGILWSTVTTCWFWSGGQRDHCDWAGNEHAFLCCLCVGEVREPELAQNEDVDMFLADNLTFPCAEQVIFDQFLCALGIGYDPAGGLLPGPPPLLPWTPSPPCAFSKTFCSSKTLSLPRQDLVCGIP